MRWDEVHNMKLCRFLLLQQYSGICLTHHLYRPKYFCVLVNISKIVLYIKWSVLHGEYSFSWQISSLLRDIKWLLTWWQYLTSFHYIHIILHSLNNRYMVLFRKKKINWVILEAIHALWPLLTWISTIADWMYSSLLRTISFLLMLNLPVIVLYVNPGSKYGSAVRKKPYWAGVR